MNLTIFNKLSFDLKITGLGMEKGKFFPAFSHSVFSEDKVDSLIFDSSIPALSALLRVVMAPSSSFLDPEGMKSFTLQ